MGGSGILQGLSCLLRMTLLYGISTSESVAWGAEVRKWVQFGEKTLGLDFQADFGRLVNGLFCISLDNVEQKAFCFW